MKNFGIIFGAELKKILSKKAMWATLIAGILLIGTVEVSDLFFEHYDYPDISMSGVEYEQLQREKGEAITGDAMDDAFYERFRNEMKEFGNEHQQDIEKIVDTDGSGYTDLWFCAERTGNQWLLSKELRAIGTETEGYEKLITGGTAAQIEKAKREELIYRMNAEGIGDSEQAYWIGRYDSIEKPFIYSYSQGYITFYECIFVMIWLVFLVMVIGLSGVFADENTCRTDALILSSRNGRRVTCLAKLTAGITFSAAAMLVVTGTGLLIPLLAYGAGGWNTPVQNVLVGSPYDITVGRAVIITILIAVLAAVVCGLFTMLLSLLFKNTLPVMAVQTALLLLSIFSLPDKFGILSQIWGLKPMYFLKSEVFNEYRLFPVPGGYLNCLQMAAIAYILLSAVFFFLVLRRYGKYQILGR